MTLSRSFIRNAPTTPLDARIMNMAELVANADGTPRAGVLGGANMSIVSTTGTMNLAVAAAEFATTKGRSDGVAVFGNDGVVNVPVSAAPVSNSRITTLWVKHNDDTTGDANALPVFGTTDGAAAPIPTPPAIPTGALELAQLRIYSGTTATNGGSNTLTNTYKMTAARGGIVPFRTFVERDAWTAPGPIDGQLAFVAEGDALFEYLATAPTPGWYHVAGAPVFSTITYPGGGAAYGPYATAPLALYEQAGSMHLEGAFTNGAAATFAAGTAYAFASFPATLAPSRQQKYIGTFGDTGVTQLTVNTDGTMLIRFTTAPGSVGIGVLVAFLSGITWRAKGLG